MTTMVKEKQHKAGDSMTPFIDFPQEGEEVTNGEYTVRVSAEPDSEVQLSVNQGAWQPCRNSAGYWWFDWRPEEAGQFTIVARSNHGGEKWNKSEERTVQIRKSH